ncbi:hypothetical protein R3P38DRAFT_3168851 [Favolaschia claudopus]|uniref:F-box domain-containing protein n=1 Tax=Favolaschia claudopus TaxID=2862362 RepID=A0AAW0DWI0_9AGAR
MDSQTLLPLNSVPQSPEQKTNRLRKRMEQQDMLIAMLDKALDEAVAIKKTLQAEYAGTVSVDALPDELLITVFDEAVNSFEDDHDVQRRMVLHALLAVCRRWLHLALRMPELWSVITVDIPSDPDYLRIRDKNTWSDRPPRFSPGKQIPIIHRHITSSRSRPLNVRIHDYTGKHAPAALAALGPAADRVLELDMAIHVKDITLTSPMVFSALQSLHVCLSSAAANADWPTIIAPHLREFRARNVPAVTQIVTNIPLVHLTILELRGPFSQLKCHDFIRLLAHTPQLVEARAVLMQRSPYGDEPAATFPQVPPLNRLEKLLVELQPRYFEEWKRDPQPWLDVLTLTALETIGIPELLFDPDASDALDGLFRRSGRLPSKLLLTAWPPGEYYTVTDKYRERFPSVALPDDDHHSYIDDATASRWEEAYASDCFP